MHEKHLYEFAVIRVVPRPEREEFLNVGIIIFCKRQKFVKVMYNVDEARLRALSPEFDADQLLLNLMALEKITSGSPSGGPIARLDVPERFRWLTAIRSSAIQTSRPHPGLSTDLDQTLHRLFEELVS